MFVQDHYHDPQLSGAGANSGLLLLLLLLLLRAHQLKLWKHLSLEAYCAPVNFHQHIFSIPVSLIQRQRSLSEAVLISFGSTNSFPKML